jgi:hypothetical protein
MNDFRANLYSKSVCDRLNPVQADACVACGFPPLELLFFHSERVVEVIRIGPRGQVYRRL